MKYIFLLSCMLFSVTVSAQSEKKYIREGNKLYEEGKYGDAENSYRKATNIKGNSFAAAYNTANSLYKQGKFTDAAAMYDSLAHWKINSDLKSKLYYNIGNSKVGAKKYEEAIEAYKTSLRINPKDQDAKYNLAYAYKMVKNHQSNDDQDGPEPSEYAKRIKKQADELVNQRKYSEALSLMLNLLQKDKTASTYNSYIKRLKDVVEINTK